MIRSRPVPSCPLCGCAGAPFHPGQADRFTDAPERWAFGRCTSGDCRLLWLDPMPLQEDIGHAYHGGYYTHQDEQATLTWYRRGFRWLKQGYLAGRYGYRRSATPIGQRLLGLAIWLLPRRRTDVDAGVMHLRFRSGGRLLEVGCGGGVLLKNLQDLGWQVEGVDFDPGAVANARAKGLTVHLGPLVAQQLPAAGFDAIVMSHVIEHVHDPRALLHECLRLLRPDGSLVVLTPNADGLCHRMFGSSCYYLDPPRHLEIFNRSNLRHVVEESGFTVATLRTRSRGGRVYWPLSGTIRRTGRADPTAPMPTAVRIAGLAAESLEAVLITVRPGAGGEILLVARPRRVDA